MNGIHDLTLFIISGLLLNMAPGPDSLLIVSRSATQGWRAGSAAALGIGSGTMVHIFAAAFGLSALLAASATAFTLVKYMGAAYLLYIGIKSLFSTSTTTPLTPLQPSGYCSIFGQGFLTNILNPKVAIFFLAFVPQFIAADAPSKPLAFILLGCIFNVNGMIWCHFLAFSSERISRRIRISPRLKNRADQLIGLVFISFGIRLALFNRT